MPGGEVGDHVVTAATAAGTAAATVRTDAMPSSMFSTSQPITMVRGAVPPSAVKRGEHGSRIHAVRLETGCGGEGFVICLEDVKRPGCPPIGDGIDEYQCTPLLEQVIREVHAPDSVVDRMHIARRGAARRDMAHHLGSETIVSEEDVADAGYQNS